MAANNLLNNLSRSKPLLLLLVLSIFWGPSCDKKDNAEALKSLKLSIDSVYSQRLSEWDSIVKEDDKKIRYMGRMLDEISYQVPYNETQMDQLRSQIRELSGKKFLIDEISLLEKVDQYDMATDSLIRDLNKFVSETPSASDIPLVSELMVDIRTFDNNVLQRRNRFDDATLRLNGLIEENKRALKKLGGPYAEMEPFPVFVLYPG